MADVVIACDHAAFDFKIQLKEYLIRKGMDVVDVGTHVPERCDYPDFASKACAKIQNGEAKWGLLLCGTGIGMSMSANRCTGIRAAVVSDTFSAAATRAHNNANVLCLGARVVGFGLAENIIDAWCGASFEGGRHQGRIDKMMSINKGKSYE
jgi:ribose 5-phosphate isomerase B